MLPLPIEIIISTVIFLVGVFAGIQMKQATQHTVVEWRLTGRYTNIPQRRIRSLITLATGFAIGLFVLPHIPAYYNTLIWLPFGAGMACSIIFLLVQ